MCDAGLRRSGKSCRLRWMNYLRPNLKHGNISVEEERIIIELHQKWGNRWSKIARRLPGRTDNEIKNYWRSYSKKKAPLVENGKLQWFLYFLIWYKQCELEICFWWAECGSNTSLRSECAPTSPMKNDVCDAMGSPYEARLTEWMSNWPPHNKDDSFDCNVYTPEWISGDWSTSTWDISLWDGEWDSQKDCMYNVLYKHIYINLVSLMKFPKHFMVPTMLYSMLYIETLLRFHLSHLPSLLQFLSSSSLQVRRVLFVLFSGSPASLRPIGITKRPNKKIKIKILERLQLAF